MKGPKQLRVLLFGRTRNKYHPSLIDCFVALYRLCWQEGPLAYAVRDIISFGPVLLILSCSLNAFKKPGLFGGGGGTDESASFPSYDLTETTPNALLSALQN